MASDHMGKEGGKEGRTSDMYARKDDNALRGQNNPRVDHLHAALETIVEMSLSSSSSEHLRFEHQSVDAWAGGCQYMCFVRVGTCD